MPVGAAAGHAMSVHADGAAARRVNGAAYRRRYSLWTVRAGRRVLAPRRAAHGRGAGGKLLLNGKPLYLRGVHMHGDSPLRGRGDDDVHNLVDVQALVAAHANWVRIHPPPSEALLDLLDEAGILVSAEVPAIGMRSPPGLGGAAFAADRINGSTLAAHFAT